jgi:hypothetical protein
MELSICIAPLCKALSSDKPQAQERSLYVNRNLVRAEIFWGMKYPSIREFTTEILTNSQSAVDSAKVRVLHSPP